jgi:hypothetical protein
MNFNVPLNEDERAILGATIETINGKRRKDNKASINRGDLVVKLVKKFNDKPEETLNFLEL